MLVMYCMQCCMGLGLTNLVGTGGVWDMCLGYGCVGGMRGWLGPGSGRVGGVMSVL